MPFPFPSPPVFHQFSMRDALIARMKAVIIMRQIKQSRRHSVVRYPYPGPVIMRSSVPPVCKGAIPVPVIEQQIYGNVGNEINIGPGYLYNEWWSGNV
jgi:hypothetical protein